MSRSITDLPLSLKPSLKPDYLSEIHLISKGFQAIAGVDEVGRGPLAGPVVTAAVILDPYRLPIGLNDSKKLSKKKRNFLYDDILKKALSVSICSLSAKTIDMINIRKAALEAMRRAVFSLSIKADFVLIDGRDIPPHLDCPATALIKGDQRSMSIAAASIIAKVTRDRMMERISSIYPVYGFDRHAGYGTEYHRDALIKKGAVEELHRFSFAPLNRKS
ncbi:ribonuclease HII [Bartonella tamiae]|uniref:Ribonuclease HII n=1 Tax=Bartonella tamiae Th239 TaxID=1094558 RepID=J1JZG2_9HYPH|nr:ribonuclease HII [Bartonella tamiae]EJF90507.1 hypothetical protein ME5_00908 [Bartonella tamiae Th239]EJF93549.1 hypothetical protein MEG_00973 [Bartonella tamiae Th307]